MSDHLAMVNSSKKRKRKRKRNAMVDWSALPDPAVALIARRLELIEDFVSFRRTCTSWRAATDSKDFFNRSCPKLPLLMLNRSEDEDDDEHEFFSLSMRKICNIYLPEAMEVEHCLGSKGWLITIGSSDEMSLLNPITRVQIPLPIHPKHCFPFRTAVLSASPSETSEYVVVIACKATDSRPNALGYVSFWKPGDKIWTEIEILKGSYWVDDLKYFNGKFYALGLGGPCQILMYDFLGPNPKKPTIIMHLPWHISRPNSHLIECAGRLLVIAPFYTDLYDLRYFDDLEMVELDVIKGTYTNITSLGNSAVFLGYDDGFSIDATRFPGVLEPNSIYSSHGHYQKVGNPNKFRFCDINGSPILGLTWIHF